MITVRIVRIVRFVRIARGWRGSCTHDRIMATVSLRDLYAAELHDLMHAENQIVAELPYMATRATSERLSRALEDHHAKTQAQIERLRLLLEQLNEPPRAIQSGAIAAFIDEGRRRL